MCLILATRLLSKLYQITPSYFGNLDYIAELSSDLPFWYLRNSRLAPSVSIYLSFRILSHQLRQQSLICDSIAKTTSLITFSIPLSSYLSIFRAYHPEMLWVYIVVFLKVLCKLVSLCVLSKGSTIELYHWSLNNILR